MFSDLQPYVCTFEDCDATLFSTRIEWIKHEMEIHRRRWQCIRCDGSSEFFTTERDMIEHLRSQHADTITETQASIILKVCERPVTKFGSSACPLCSEWNPLLTDETNAKQFFRHLARHQQQVALEALPLYVDGLEIRDSEFQEPGTQSSSGSEQESDDEGLRDTVTSTEVFGVSLNALYERTKLAVPMIVYQCIQAIDLFGLAVENIYKDPSPIKDIRVLRQRRLLRKRFESFDNATMFGPTIDFRNTDNFYNNVHNAAGLLKEYLRRLPDPLLMRQFHDPLISAVKLNDIIERRDGIHMIINQLPDPHYATIRCLILHLNRIMHNASVNGMTADQLGGVFGPVLMNAADTDATWEKKTISTILQHTYDIFDDDEEDDSLDFNIASTTDAK